MATPTDLAQALRELTEACEAEYCSADTDGEGDDNKVAFPEESCSITFGMIRRARAALKAHESRAQPASVSCVPGVMHCAKCHFRLVRTNLYVRNGTTGPGGNETEPCPNGCGPLWPVTWEQEARECWERIEQMALAPQPAQPASVAKDVSDVLHEAELMLNKYKRLLQWDSHEWHHAEAVRSRVASAAALQPPAKGDSE